MSKFVTPVVVADAVKRVSELLPKGAFLERIRWDAEKQTVEVIWDHHPYRTGRDFPVTFDEAHLKAGTLPEGVTDAPFQPRPRPDRKGAKPAPKPGPAAPAEPKSQASAPGEPKAGVPTAAKSKSGGKKTKAE